MTVGAIYVPMGSYTKNIQFKTFWGEDPGWTMKTSSSLNALKFFRRICCMCMFA